MRKDTSGVWEREKCLLCRGPYPVGATRNSEASSKRGIYFSAYRPPIHTHTHSCRPTLRAIRGSSAWVALTRQVWSKAKMQEEGVVMCLKKPMLPSQVCVCA